MKNIFTSICILVISITLVFSQGSECFKRLPEKSVDFYTGSFEGENGINWNFIQAKKQLTFSKEGIAKSFLVLKGEASAEISSSVISGGIGLLKIEYTTSSGSPVNFEVFINSTAVATLTSPATENVTSFSSDNLFVNLDKPFYIRIKQSNETSGQVNIEKISWSKFASREIGINAENIIPVAKNRSVKNDKGLPKDQLNPVYHIFPNPAKEYVFIEMSEYHNVILKLFTLAGQMVLQEQVKGSGQKISINSLKEGLYIYKILDDKGKLVTGKMVIR